MKSALATLLLILCASAQTDQTNTKQLSIYGCVPLFTLSFTNSDYAKVCKLYEPETHRRFIIGVVDDGKGGGITIVPLDK